jgi:hypothetical protein
MLLSPRWREALQDIWMERVVERSFGDLKAWPWTLQETCLWQIQPIAESVK